MYADQTSSATTVWVVEDDFLFGETVEKLLEATSGIQCLMTFDSGEEALEVLERGDAPDVVLMDIGLTGMSGIECTRKFKAASPSTHIVILTVHEDDDKIFRAICAGATGYLLKPSSGPQIVSSIRAARDGEAPINPRIASKVLEMFTTYAVPKGDYGLTEREREILQYLVQGRTKKRIASDLFLSYHTVDMHVRNIYAKLQVHSRSRAVAKALKERLI